MKTLISIIVMSIIGQLLGHWIVQSTTSTTDWREIVAEGVFQLLALITFAGVVSLRISIPENYRRYTRKKLIGDAFLTFLGVTIFIAVVFLGATQNNVPFWKGLALIAFSQAEVLAITAGLLVWWFKDLAPQSEASV